MMKKIILITFLIGLMSNGLFAKEINFESFIKQDKSNLIQNNNSLQIDLNYSELTPNLKHKKVIKINNFPTSHGTIDLLLKLNNSVYTEDAKVFVNNDNGRFEVQRNHNSYSGKVIGNPQSEVFLSFSNFGIIGMIKEDFMTSTDISTISKENNDIKLVIKDVETQDFLNQTGINFCGTEEVTDFVPHQLNDKIKQENFTQDEGLLQVKIAAEANFEYYLKFAQIITNGAFNQWNSGSRWYFNMTAEEKSEARELALDYLENVIAMSSRIYEREANIKLDLSFVEMFETPGSCPYYAGLFQAPLSSKLNAVRQIWRNKNNAPDRTITTLFTDNARQPSTSSTLGIAYVGNNYSGTLCSNRSGYSALGMIATAQFPQVSFTQDVQVAAHEFGHNFGCPHTHFCGLPQLDGGPVIDSCVSEQQAGDAYCISPAQRRPKPDGTIMSYCHFGGGIVYDFNPRMISRIRNHAENESCISSYPDPIVRLIRPLGEENFFINTTETIRFTSANVNQITLSYSTDNGESWEVITTKNTNSTDSYEWDIPDVINSNILMKIEDSNNPNIFDITLVPFAITQFAVAEVFPLQGDDVGYIQESLLRWNKTNVEEVDVSYSTDGGGSWNVIGKNIINNSITYDFPDKEVQNALLLIRSSEDNSINTTVSFNIGRESVEFTNPTSNDILCNKQDSVIITFNREFVQDFNLEVSFDQGANWQRITNFVKKIDPINNRFLWQDNFTDIEDGQELFIRASLKNSDNTIIGQTEEGILIEGGNCLTTNVTTNLNFFRIDNINPNPAQNKTEISFFNGLNKLVRADVKVIDINGNVLFNKDKIYLNSGFNYMEINTSNFSSGNYYIIINSEDYSHTQSLKILR